MNSKFSPTNKKSLAIGGELAEDGLIWRKRKDGTGTWRYDFWRNGVRHKGILGNDKDGWNLSKARDRLREIKVEAAKRQQMRGAASPLRDMTFGQLTKQFLIATKDTYLDADGNQKKAAQHALPYFGNLKVREITAGHLESFRAHLLDKGLSASTVNKHVYLVSAIFEFARRRDPSISNPQRGLKRLRQNIPAIEILTEDEQEELLRAAGSEPKAEIMTGLALYAGLRASEILGLDWKDVHLDDASPYIHICQTATKGVLRRTTKSGKARRAPIRRPLQRILARYYEKGQTGLVIPGRYADQPMYQLQDTFQRTVAASGINRRKHFHMLRHTFATWAVARPGVTVPMVQAWLGHADIAMTMRYVHEDGTLTPDALDLLDAA